MPGEFFLLPSTILCTENLLVVHGPLPYITRRDLWLAWYLRREGLTIHNYGSLKFDGDSVLRHYTGLFVDGGGLLRLMKELFDPNVELGWLFREEMKRLIQSKYPQMCFAITLGLHDEIRTPRDPLTPGMHYDDDIIHGHADDYEGYIAAVEESDPIVSRQFNTRVVYRFYRDVLLRMRSLLRQWNMSNTEITDLMAKMRWGDNGEGPVFRVMSRKDRTLCDTHAIMPILCFTRTALNHPCMSAHHPHPDEYYFNEPELVERFENH